MRGPESSGEVEPRTPWRSPSPQEAAAWLAKCAPVWWVAGGHAIDLFLGRALRPHADLDLGCFRDDWPRIRGALAAWEFHAAKDRRFTPLLDDRPPDHTHVVWGRPSADAPWTLEFLLEERDGAAWTFRRDARVRRPADGITFGRDALRVLRPEIQLLYKAKAPRPKDVADFEAAVPTLDDVARTWLHDALAIAHPTHPWIARLA